MKRVNGSPVFSLNVACMGTDFERCHFHCVNVIFHLILLLSITQVLGWPPTESSNDYIRFPGERGSGVGKTTGQIGFFWREGGYFTSKALLLN